MKPSAQRKLTRFYIINPIGDRRIEQRFESREDVVLRFPESGKVAPAVAVDIGRMGLRLETPTELPMGADVEVAFPKAADHIRCFGRIAWVKPVEGGNGQLAGVAIEVWHGVVLGEDSWTRFKNTPKKDRRNKTR